MKHFIREQQFKLNFDKLEQKRVVEEDKAKQKLAVHETRPSETKDLGRKGRGSSRKPEGFYDEQSSSRGELLETMLAHLYYSDEDARLKLEHLYNLLDQEDQQEAYSEELEEFFKLMEINESEEQEDQYLLKYFSSTIFDVHSDRLQEGQIYHHTPLVRAPSFT